jgi:anti-sigma regulatory factor (Ser/Thr protein kinase)/putative methionine-R-sulfoxide reductase with GAF domain
MDGAEVDAAEEAWERLRRMRSLTDRNLANLETDALLDELLDRAREILHADTAAVLLLDDSRTELVATVARGLEEEVRQNVRIPVGRGFAGRIAAERRPVSIERVDHSTVLNPLLRDKGIRSLLGVPLQLDGDLLGVLHVGTLGSRHFTEADGELLQLVGDRVALALGTRRVTTERTASVALQASLVPVQLPHIPGLELSGRYVPAENGGVGGDWYDVFTLPTGHVYFSVGDVVGRGLQAAVVMGRLRSTIRAYALDHRDPAEVVAKVDRKLLHFEPTEMATMLLAVLDPAHRTMRVSVAGHPPPVVAFGGVAGDVSARSLDVAVDPPLGVREGVHRRSTTVDLASGAVVCFFTDGLVERRGVPLETRLDILRALVTTERPDTVCARAMSALVGLEPPSDDVALLVFRRLADRQFTDLHMVVPAKAAELSRIRAGVRRWLAAVGATPADVTDLLVAVGEACSNVIEHAYGPRAGGIDLRMSLEPAGPAGPADPDGAGGAARVVVRVQDRGTWRSARGHNRGRGLRLIEGFCDEHRIEAGPEGTEVVMWRRIGEGMEQ